MIDIDAKDVLPPEVSKLVNSKNDVKPEEAKEEINRKLQKVKSELPSFPNVTFTYFIKDAQKDGGAYITTYSVVKKIDENRNVIILDNREEIPINDIFEIKNV